MGVRQSPYIGDGGGGPVAAPNLPQSPSTPELDRPEPSRKPGNPPIDYEFGDSQGWNNKPGNGLGVTLLPQEAPTGGGMGMTLMPDRGPDLLKPYNDAYRDLKEWGVIGAVASTAAVAALGPASGVLGAFVLLSFVASWTNVAVHAAGGGDAFKKTSGLFGPGLLAFTADTLRGASVDDALRRAQHVEYWFDVSKTLKGFKVPETVPEMGKLALKLDSLYGSARRLGYIKESAAPGGAPVGAVPHPQCTIRKPGGPLKLP